MEAGLSDCRAVFHGATRIALRDGQLSNGEKRLLVKLAHALRLEEEEPKQVLRTCWVDPSAKSPASPVCKRTRPTTSDSLNSESSGGT